MTASPVSAQAAIPTFGDHNAVPYTKWYRVWERVSYRDFWQEAFILPFVLAIICLHVWGRGKNKRKARSWIQAHAPVLEKEFAIVGFGGRKTPSIDDAQSSGLAKASLSGDSDIPSELLKEKTAQEYVTYATGRQNVAFLDAKIKLFKRYNPGYLVAETVMAFFMASIKAPAERMEVTAYAFDGKEKDLIPVPKQERDSLEARVKGLQSSYDGFVWAVVNKDGMRQLRDDRYDISLTSTKDHPRLPPWMTVMSESAEVTETLLTPELIKAIEQAGDAFEHLIVTDQPEDKPLKYVPSTSSFLSPLNTPPAKPPLPRQTQRNHPPQTHASLPAPPRLHLPHRLHRHPPTLHPLPAPARPPRQRRTLPPRSAAQDPRDARVRNRQAPKGRRGRKGGGEEVGGRSEEEGSEGGEVEGDGRGGAEEVFGEGEGEGAEEAGEEDDEEGVGGRGGEMGGDVDSMLF